jgi:pimeloyl-ACP methyl ester carboxylesterase
MRLKLCVLALLLSVQVDWAQSVRTTFVSLGPANAILMEPSAPGVKSRIALVYTYPLASLSLSSPRRNNFNHPSGPQLASRGYRVLLLNNYNERVGYESYVADISRAIKYFRSLQGVERVLLLGHSAGGPLVAFYQNVAENGPRACQGPEKIYPCRGELDNLPKADGIVMMDSHLGEGFRAMTYVDPAISEAHPRQRNAALDLFDPANGYNAAANSANYSDTFVKKFFAAQAARNEKLIAAAQARLSAIEKGQSKYKGDEPFEIPEICCARLLQADTKLVSHTKGTHPLLKTDGTMPTQIIKSVRPPMGQDDGIGAYEQYSVRGFLAGQALRTTPEYMMTEDSITGVDWASSSTSAPTNVERIRVPLLIMTMTCHYFVVPDEIIFDHAGSKDKQIAYVEGASHGFTPCRPEYGDTMKRTFDYVDGWLSDARRFGSR